MVLRDRSTERTYHIRRMVAAGGMGEVYEADAPSLGRKVAIKRMLEQTASDASLFRLFLREILIASTLEHHNITEVIDVGQVEGELYLVMELVDGPTLAAVLEVYYAQTEHLPMNVACGLAMQIAQGLAHAHERCLPDGTPLGIVHRDVAPENILIGQDGVPKLVDFGLAKLDGQDLTQPGVIRGRPRSLAPEQARGEPTDARTDVFALGAILFEMVSGQWLYPHEDIVTLLYLVASCKYEPIGPRIPGADPGLVEIIEKALNPTLNARHRSARQFERELGSFRAARELRLTNQAIAEVVHQTWPAIVQRRTELVQGRDGFLNGQTIVLPADELELPPQAPDFEAEQESLESAWFSSDHHFSGETPTEGTEAHPGHHPPWPPSAAHPRMQNYERYHMPRVITLTILLLALSWLVFDLLSRP